MSIRQGLSGWLNRTEMIIFFGCHHKSGYLFHFTFESILGD